MPGRIATGRYSLGRSNYAHIKAIAVIRFLPFGDGVKTLPGGGFAEVEFEAFGAGVVVDYFDGGIAQIKFEPFGGGYKATEDLYFIDEPTILIQPVIATHITVRSPTHEYTSSLPDIPTENRIEREMVIEEGNEAVCKMIGEAVLEKWGRTQRSISGTTDLVVTTRFRQKMRIWIPVANIDEFMILQKKEHDIFNNTTRVTLGDVILSEHEIIARMMSENRERRR